MKIFAFIFLVVFDSCNNQPDCIPPVFKDRENAALPHGVSAKRAVPKPVAPIIIDSVRYSAPDSLMGYIEARNSQTNTFLWKKQVYKIVQIPDLEEDVPDVFIDSLVSKCSYLFIHNEKNDVYKLDLKTLQVFKL